MRILDPERVHYTTTMDVVDYITKGLPPSQKQFDHLVANLDDLNAAGFQCNPGALSNWQCDPVLMGEIKDVLTEVHKNQVKNRNKAIAAGAAAALVALCAGMNIGESKAERRMKN